MAAGCIVVPRDPWGGHGGHGGHRRGGHHFDQQPQQQPTMNDYDRRRPDGGRR